MKKLVVLSTVAMLTVGATGCHRCCSWHRKPRATAVMCPPAPMAAPAASPCCDPGATVYGEPMPTGQTFISPAPIVTPGPVTSPTE